MDLKLSSQHKSSIQSKLKSIFIEIKEIFSFVWFGFESEKFKMPHLPPILPWWIQLFIAYKIFNRCDVRNQLLDYFCSETESSVKQNRYHASHTKKLIIYFAPFEAWLINKFVQLFLNTSDADWEQKEQSLTHHSLENCGVRLHRVKC